MKRKTKVKFIIGAGYLALFCLSYNACGWFFQSDLWDTIRARTTQGAVEQYKEQKAEEEAQRPKDITITLPTEEQQGSVTVYQRDEAAGEIYQESYTGTIKEQSTKGNKRNISIYTY